MFETQQPAAPADEIATEEQLSARIAALGPVDDETRNKVVCALIGHSRIVTNCFGYQSCARCSEQIGDTLMGVGVDGAVYVGHDCAVCRSNFAQLGWKDKVFAPHPFPQDEQAEPAAVLAGLAAPAAAPGAVPTPGPWRVGKNYGSVVSDERPAGYPYDGKDPGYGGFVICESCTEPNANAIAQLPDLISIAIDVATKGAFSGYTADPDMRSLIERASAVVQRITGRPA